MCFLGISLLINVYLILVISCLLMFISHDNQIKYILLKSLLKKNK